MDISELFIKKITYSYFFTNRHQWSIYDSSVVSCLGVWFGPE